MAQHGVPGLQIDVAWWLQPERLAEPASQDQWPDAPGKWRRGCRARREQAIELYEYLTAADRYGARYHWPLIVFAGWGTRRGVTQRRLIWVTTDKPTEAHYYGQKHSRSLYDAATIRHKLAEFLASRPQPQEIIQLISVVELLIARMQRLEAADGR